VLREEGKSERAIFIIDKEGIVQYVDIHDIDEQPENEVLFQEIRRIQPDHKPVKIPEEKKSKDKLISGVQAAGGRGFGLKITGLNTPNMMSPAIKLLPSR